MARASGITKAQGYLNRVYTVEYDLKGMVDAYGVDFMHYLLDRVAAGEINCKQSVDRWSADVALNGSYNFDPAAYMHNDDLADDSDILDLIEKAA